MSCFPTSPARFVIGFLALVGVVFSALTCSPARAGSLAELIYSFPIPAGGPWGELVQAADQSFYGTTSAGGASGAGTLFRIAPDGTFRTAAEFTGFTGALPGAQPSAQLVLGGDGNYYGVCAQGGADGLGTIFKLLPDGTAVTVVTFSGNGETFRGALPFAPLLPGEDGYLYGTTSRGGLYNLGTVFKMAEADGSLTTLVEFGGKVIGAKGANPYAALVKGPDGALYGTTAKGGKSDHGTIYSVTTNGTLKTLVEFTDLGPKKGAAPYAALTLFSDGNFYGTTARGGAGDNGTIFQMTPAGALKTLAEFTGRAGKKRGALPESPLVVGPDASFYGTTFAGGKYNVGTIYKVTPAGDVTTLIDFGGPNRGAQPQAGLVLGQNGKFRGTTLRGGKGNSGTVFEVSASGELRTLLEFPGVNPDTYSQGGIIRAKDDNFYGVSAASGLFGKGSVFQITSLGAATTLSEFSDNGGPNSPKNPRAPLLQAQNGDFYGVTVNGGTQNLGTIFKITSDGVLTFLAEFTGIDSFNKGAFPRAALIQTSPDDFYGVTSQGGAADAGTIFHMTATGTLTTLVEFTGEGGTNKGTAPDSSLVLGSDLNLHGTTARGGARGFGTVFTMTPEGVLTTQVEFADDPAGIKGAYPEASLIQASDGNYYGTTATGGTTGDGTIFRVSTAGEITTLVEFTGRRGKNKGTRPTGALFQASDGNLYGTTGFGGASNYGTAFRMTLGGQLTTVAELTYKDGAYPETGFVLGSDGNLYTTTALGGNFGAGAVIRLRLRTATDLAEAVAISPFTAQLRSRLKMGVLPSTVYFEYGVESYDQRTPDQSIARGSDDAFITANLAGLLPNTVYKLRTVTVDSDGTLYGRDETFTTGPAVAEILSSGGSINGEPETTVITTFGVPSIADNEAVAVIANLATAAGNDVAILVGAPPVVIVRKGSLAPLSEPGATATFAAFDDPICDSAGSVAFTARIQLGGKSAFGLWTNAGGTLAEVARVGGAVPGVNGAKFATLISYAMGQDGVVFYAGSIAGGGASATNNSGLWAFDETGNHLLLRKGDTINSLRITNIAALGPVTGSTGQGRGYFGHTLTARVTLSDRSQAVVQLAPGVAPVVIGPTPFSLPETSPARMVTGVGAPSISVDGSAAFLAKLKDEQPVIVADTATSPLAIMAQAGAPAPGADPASFGKFADPVYNAQSQVAFLATLRGFGVTGKTQNGVWWKSNAGLSLVARAGAGVPTIPAARWNAFVTLALPDNAGLVFLAKLAANSEDSRLPSDVTKTTDLGLFSVDGNRAPRLLVRTGDRIEVRGTQKELSLITILGAVPGSPGQARSYNASGDLVFRATFTDHTQAIMRIHLP
jgi:uncharacterized repeat protein (TIGR03803 family)